jgi:predicted permease
MLSDFQYALRQLLKAPGFTAIAVLTLALAIGANTAIFSVIDAVLLRPLPFPDASRLVAVWEETRLFGLRYSPPAMGNYVDWRSQNQTFTEMGLFEDGNAVLADEAQAEEVRCGVVTASLFQALQVSPAAGRLWNEGEDLPGAPKTVVLSDRLWRRRFAADPNLVGQSIRISGEPHTVIGIMPANFGFPNQSVALWLPVGSRYNSTTWQDRGRHNFLVVGRLKSDVTLAQANADLRAVAARLQRDFPDTNTDLGTFAAPLREHEAGRVRPLYLILFAAVGLLLLTACANLANLLLARMAGRSHETAVRLALGAGRRHILRQSLLESLLLGLAGGGLGLLVAWWSVEAIRPLVPTQIVGLAGLDLDWRVLGFALAVTLVASVVIGCAPWWQLSRTDSLGALKQGGRNGPGAHAGRLQSILVVVQLALSLTLVTGAGLLVRTFAQLRTADLGFQSEQVLLARLSGSALWAKQFRSRETRDAFYRDVLQRVQALPGVVSAGFTSGAPLVMKGDMTRILPENTAVASPNQGALTVNSRAVSPGYLSTIGLPLLRGRHLTTTDTPDSPSVVLINAALARKFWPDREDPVGQRFRVGSADGPWFTVIGVVGDMKQTGVDLPATPEMYFSCFQLGRGAAHLVVRTTTAPAQLAPLLRHELAAIDPLLPIVELTPLSDVVEREISPRRLQAVLLGAFASLALLVAALGLYGVVSYAVTRRTREFGVRTALGARPRDIVLHELRRNLRILVPGLALGLLIALGLTQLMTRVLYGIAPHDPATFAGAAGLLLLVAVLACWLPARRATRINPVEALRAE